MTTLALLTHINNAPKHIREEYPNETHLFIYTLDDGDIQAIALNDTHNGTYTDTPSGTTTFFTHLTDNQYIMTTNEEG